MKYLAEDKQDNAIIDELTKDLDINYNKRKSFEEFLKKASTYLRTQYNYTLKDFILQVGNISINDFLEAYEKDQTHVDLIDDLMYAEEESQRKKKALFIDKSRHAVDP